MIRRPGWRGSRPSSAGTGRVRGHRVVVGAGVSGAGALLVENAALRAENERLRAWLRSCGGRGGVRRHRSRGAFRRMIRSGRGDGRVRSMGPGRIAGSLTGLMGRSSSRCLTAARVVVGCLTLSGGLTSTKDIVVPVRGHVRRFRVAVGRCGRCGRRAHGRHPLQTSDALGAAAAQVGGVIRLLAVAAETPGNAGSFGRETPTIIHGAPYFCSHCGTPPTENRAIR
jgi:hypothetical protein